MDAHIVTGGVGSGKSLLTVMKVREELLKGNRIAINFDLNLDKLVGIKHKEAHVIRIPDQPTRNDLMDIGLGSDVRGEENFGTLVLDEAALFLNTRDMGKGEIKELVKFMIHVRKRRWNIMILCQHKDMLDKQIKGALNASIVYVKRLDKMPIFLLTYLFGIFDIKLHWPRVHIGTVRIGDGARDAKKESWIARGTSLYGCYDTEQAFDLGYERGVYSLVPPWLTDGRYLPKYWKIHKFIGRCKRVKTNTFRFFFLFGLLAGVGGSTYAFTLLEGSKHDEYISNEVSRKKKPEANEQIKKTFKGVFIVGSYSYQGGISYSFQKGDRAFYPVNLGLTINAIKPCRAAFIDLRTMQRNIVTCNPYGLDSNISRQATPELAIFSGLTTTEEEE